MKKRLFSILVGVCLLVQLLPITGLASTTVTGRVERLPGYDVATIRYTLPDGSYRFADFKETEGGYDFTFPDPGSSYTVTPEYFSTAVWDGAVDLSWYDDSQSEFYLDTPAKLAGLAALVNGRVDAGTPDYRIKGNQSELVFHRMDDYLILGVGGGNQRDTAYLGDPAHDFSDKTVYLTADMDMGGSANWAPIGGVFCMDTAKSDYLVFSYFNGTLDGQGHRITNLLCNRYAAKGFAYAQDVGFVGYLGELYEGESAPAAAPSVRNLSVAGEISGRRSTGGIVGRTGAIPTGTYITNCANFAYVHNTDAKGVGGIVGAAWSKGAIVNCYNTGKIATTYACPAGGICGSNHGIDIYGCYNVGTIDSNGNQRGRGIGGHDSGSYTVSDCYYLDGCDDDPASNGWYTGTALGITVSIEKLTDQQMRSSAFVEQLNVNGAAFAAQDGGYPILLWEQAAAADEMAAVSVAPAEGGSVQTDCGASVRKGTMVRLSNSPETGYVFRGYTMNGAPLTGPYATVTEDAVFSGVFEPMVSGTLHLVLNPSCDIRITKTGTALVDGVPTDVTDYPVADGDPLYEGDRLTAVATIHDDAAPEDLDYVYNGKARYVFAFEDGTGSQTATDTGVFTVDQRITTATLSLTVEPYTTHKIWTQLPETDWYQENMSTFTLTTARQLAGLAYLVKQGNDFSGKTVCLGKDVSLLNDDKTYNRSVRWWDGIGTAQSPFSGVFDGCGYKITDMTAATTGSSSALFLATDGAVIRNLTVYGSAQANGGAAGIVVEAKSTTLQNCTNEASVSSTGEKAGGIAATLDSASTVSRCVNRGAITGTAGVGGIAGIVTDGGSKLTDCVNFGAVTGNGTGNGLGGIAGKIGGTLLRCANYGEVSGAGWYVGGVVGVAATGGASAVTNCYNVAPVSNTHTYANSGTGGIIGYGNYYALSNSFNAGLVTAAAGRTGGTVGRDAKKSTSSHDNCYYLDTTCDFASNGEATVAGMQPVTADAMADRDFLEQLNHDCCFVLMDGASYPELRAAAALLYPGQVCAHPNTVLKDAVPATCTTAGFSGNLVCTDCGEIAQPGESIPAFSCPGKKFQDMPATTDWAHPGIDFALRSQLFNGMSDTRFAPDSSMTRAMLVTVLWRLEEKPQPTSSNPFQDLTQSWYQEAVIWAAETGIVNGVGHGRFEPDGNVTREQIAAIMYRYASQKAVDVTEKADISAFPDVKSVSSWAYDALAWANAAGLVNGSASGGVNYLLPTGNATRAQVAAILMRYVQNFA